MPTVPCLNPQNCLGVDSPVANLTAEGPDIAKCFRYSFTEESSLTCEFDLSLCNAFAAIGADVGDLCSPPPSIINGTNPPLPVIYSSHAQSCTQDCGGFSETYTVVAGTFVALSQAQADAEAYQFACTLAQMQCLGQLPTLYTNVAQSCTALCPDGSTLTYTTPAGLFTALSQAEANANAFEFACTLAALLCSGLPPIGLQESAGEQRTAADTQPLWANTAQSCSAECPGGGSFTYVVPGGTYLRESRTAANNVALSLACQQAQLRRVCLSSLPTTACLQDFFAEFLSATGLTEPITFAVVGGTLPPGIDLSGALLSGSPTLGGAYSFTIRATGTDGTYAQRTYSLTVVEITPSTLPSGTTNSPYAAALSVSGMADPTWGVIGALPAGLTINPFTGVIAGTPTLAGDYAFGITVTDGSTECQKSYSITVEGGCVDWAALTWNAPTVLGFPSFPPGETGYTASPTGASASFHTTGFNNDQKVYNIQYTQNASVPFDSVTDCEASLHFIMASTFPSETDGIDFTIAVVRMDTFAVLLNFSFDGNNNGTTDHPFTIPAGTFSVGVFISWGLNEFFDPGPATIDVQGTFS